MCSKVKMYVHIWYARKVCIWDRVNRQLAGIWKSSTTARLLKYMYSIKGDIIPCLSYIVSVVR